MPILKSGARLKSTVCDGEVMVVAAPQESVDITCGAAAMSDTGGARTDAEIPPEHAVGIQIGKRYVNEDGTLELLCVKSGKGGLAANGELLLQKDTKKLPKTD